MADTTTSSSAQRPVKDNHANVDILAPASTTDAPAVPSEEPSSDPINSTIADDATAVPTATNDINGDNQDTNMDATAEKAKDQAQVDEVTGTNGATPTFSKKKEKRKSTSGVPEHKSKKLNRKKSMIELHLDVQPGEYWFVQMKGYPPWPAIICDEEMLPTTLLGKRPVSARRPDGSYREDFQEGGKNVRDRRYPVMFLGTNEFAWHVNTDLSPLDLDDIKATVDNGTQGKKSKALWEAYKIASENRDLSYFKNMLREHEERRLQLEQEEAEREAKKAAKEAKKKAKEAAANDDVDMEDVDEGGEGVKAPKSSKKRKKEMDSDGERIKPSKTPKTKLKLNGPKTPTEDSTSKPKKSSKSKKAKAKGDEEAQVTPVEPEPTEEEKREKKEKMILFLRHKLQKGFLSRDHSPKEDEMDQMNQYMKQLEQYTDLDAGIIKSTKINKVLKAILKLDSIPLEENYNFKDRSSNMLAAWAPALGLDPATAGAEPTSSKEPTTNGISHEKHERESKTEEPIEATEIAERSTDANDGNPCITSNYEGDASLATEAPAEPTPTTEEATTAA